MFKMFKVLQIIRIGQGKLQKKPEATDLYTRAKVNYYFFHSLFLYFFSYSLNLPFFLFLFFGGVQIDFEYVNGNQ